MNVIYITIVRCFLCVFFLLLISCVCVYCALYLGTCVKRVLEENEKVLKLLGSRVLQTEIRVLYELLYVLNNSLRQHKTFRILKQVRIKKKACVT